MATLSRPTQQGRKFRVETALGPDVLLLERFTGDEAVSAPYAYVLHMVSEDPALDPADLLRTPVKLAMELPDGSEHLVHGLVRRFVQLETSGRLTNYRAELVPWLWFLSLWSDCRIFQSQSVPDIVAAVFAKLGVDHFRFDLIGTYAPREFCVQYRETHLAFVQRLLEEEGIFYFFEHEAEKHTLVMVDHPGAVQPCPGQPQGRLAAQAGPWQHEDVITGVVVDRVARPGKVVLTDYNYLTPSANLQAPVAGDEPEEVYDYPGRYEERDAGERYARLRLEAYEADMLTLHGEGTCRAFQPGRRFKLQGHHRRDVNGDYLLTRVRHDGHSGGFGTGRGTDEEDYRGTFEAVPHAVPYRPARTAPRPVVHGAQTAVVVGPPGEEIWTDAHGRVKVQFHWDRLGARDDRSSCWMRVSSPWAGKGWGSLAVPRIGQEVIVEFLEGDPDRPIITGRVYNAEQTPPCDPGGRGGVVSGLRSKTHKGAGYNAMEMDDAPGKELITIHAQYDMSTTVEHDERVSVGNDRTESVGHDESITIGNDRRESVGKNETVSVGENRTEDVGKNETLSVGASQSLSVGKDQSVNVGKNQTIDVGADRTKSVGKSETTTVADNRKADVGKNDDVQVGKKFTLVAGDQIVLQTGSASITLKKDGTITIRGKDITIQGSGKVNVKASSDVVIKGSKVLTN